MIRRAAAATFALLLLVVSAEFARSADEPTRPALTAADVPAPRTDWFGLYIDGTKAGWLRLEFAKTPDAYAMTMTGRMEFAAMEQQIRMEMTHRAEFDTTPPFAFRGGMTETKEADGGQKVEVVRGKEGFLAKVTEGGELHAPPVPAVDYTLADALAAELWIRRKPAVGDRVSHRDFSISDLEMEVATLSVVARKESVVDGVKTAFYEVAMSSESDGDDGVARLDSDGRYLSIVVGGIFEARRESEEIAKEPGRGGDLFVFGMAKIDKPIGEATKVSRLVVHVDGEGGKKLVGGPRQGVAVDEKTGAVTLSLGAGCGSDAPATAKDVEDALRETVDYPTKAPRVVALAAEAVGDAKTPREKVDRLVKFVSDYVEDVRVSEHSSALEIIDSRKGDCSEHATLFATLARAAGVPAREVSGLMYMGDDVLAFGGHAWNEVALDGKWIAVDATWAQTEVDATHVALEREDDKSSFLGTIGRLAFRLAVVKRSE